MTGDKSRWNIWRTLFYYKDKPHKAKVRPFVILGMKGNSVVGMQMTSKMWRRKDPRYYEVKSLSGTGLTKPTLIDLHTVTPKDVQLLEHMGILDESDRNTLLLRIQRYYNDRRKKRREK